MDRIKTEQPWLFTAIRDDNDKLLQLVRSNSTGNVVIAGEGVGIRSHKKSAYFTKDNQPNINKPVSFQVLDASESSMPTVGEYIGLVNKAMPKPVKKRVKYTDEDMAKAVELVGNGVTVLTASRLTEVPRSAIYAALKQ